MSHHSASGSRSTIEAPWKASSARLAPDKPPPRVGGATGLGTLGPDTGLDVLMHALLGTSAPAPVDRDRPATDVESRLAEVVAAVGLTKTEVAGLGDARGAREGSAATVVNLYSGARVGGAGDATARNGRLGGLAEMMPAIRARLMRWLRLAVPALLVGVSSLSAAVG